MSARRLSTISRCGRRWVLLLARCLTALVILDGLVLLSCRSVLAQEPGPGGPAPGADAPIDAGINPSKFEPFRKALRDVRAGEQHVEYLTQKIGEAEMVLRLAEQGLSQRSLEGARKDLDELREQLRTRGVGWRQPART